MPGSILAKTERPRLPAHPPSQIVQVPAIGLGAHPIIGVAMHIDRVDFVGAVDAPACSFIKTILAESVATSPTLEYRLVPWTHGTHEVLLQADLGDHIS